MLYKAIEMIASNPRSVLQATHCVLYTASLFWGFMAAFIDKLPPDIYLGNIVGTEHSQLLEDLSKGKAGIRSLEMFESKALTTIQKVINGIREQLSHSRLIGFLNRDDVRQIMENDIEAVMRYKEALQCSLKVLKQMYAKTVSISSTIDPADEERFAVSFNSISHLRRLAEKERKFAEEVKEQVDRTGPLKTVKEEEIEEVKEKESVVDDSSICIQQ